MTSPRERDERDFFDSLTAGSPSEAGLPRAREFADVNGIDSLASDVALGATEMIRLTDHLPPATMPRSAQPQQSPAERRQTDEPAQILPRGRQHYPPRSDDGWKVGAARPPGRSVEEPRAADVPREQLRATDLITPRKTPPSTGWRKALYLLSGKTVNVGESLDERRVRGLKAAVDTNLRGTYTVAVLGGKGGAGKTAMTVAIGSVFAWLRNDRVVAVDADPAQAANLAARVDSKAASMREINNDNNLMRYADVRALTGQNEVGLDVVASPHHAGSGVVLTANEFTSAHTRLQRFYSVLFIDCGVDLDHAVMTGVLERADALMMVASAVPDGAAGTSASFEWLRDRGYHQLLSRAVLVINHIHEAPNGKGRKSTVRLVGTLVEHFGQWVPRQRIAEVPFDRHIASAGVVEFDQLDSVTNRRVLEAAAAVASGFSTTTDLR